MSPAMHTKSYTHVGCAFMAAWNRPSPRDKCHRGGVCEAFYFLFFILCDRHIRIYLRRLCVCVCVCDVGDDEKASVFFKTQKTKKKTNKKASLFTQKCEYVSYPIV